MRQTKRFAVVGSDARRLGHTALHALSLPTVWAPETAGEALARTVQAILQEREGTI